MDLRDPLPVPDASVERIYSSFVLEHFYHDDLMRLLHECQRVLKVGGSMRVAVPDARTYLDACFRPETFDRKRWPVYEPGMHYHTPIDYVNYVAYMDNTHRHMFDMANLLAVLEDAGFQDVGPSEFNPTIDLEVRRYESIYAETVKRG